MEKDLKMKKSLWLGAALTAAFTLSVTTGRAAAADAGHAFAVHGVGALTCAGLNATPAKDAPAMRGLLASWLLGYVTAMNRTQDVTYDATPVQDQFALVNMVAGVCSQHPTLPVETVAFAVLHSLEKAKLATASPEVTVTVGKLSTVLRKDTLDKLQLFLVAQAYLTASQANGTFGPKTQAALVKFQTAQKLPATGLPDPATVVRALVEMKPS
jgi:hypothetical protein